MKISVDLEPEVAEQLAQFCKRCSHDTFINLTEGHLSDNERTKRAYQMMYGIDAVASALSSAGISPR
jgi:hypothetical protein